MSKKKGPSFEYFPAARVALNREVKYHPELMKLLIAYNPVTQFPDMIGEIAAYCGIMVDGTYTPKQLDDMCDVLYRELVSSRQIIITGEGPPAIH